MSDAKMSRDFFLSVQSDFYGKSGNFLHELFSHARLGKFSNVAQLTFAV